MPRINKDHPPPHWVAALQQRYPCEAEIDRTLRRKLARRSDPPYAPVGLEALTSGLEALLRARLGSDFTVTQPVWMTGGASKLQISFQLDWDAPGIGRTRTPLVLRMEPPASIVESSRLREFQILKALTGHVPVPPAYWCDPDGEFFPYPAMVCGFVQGVTKPTGGHAAVSGTGASFSPELGRVLGREFISHMAALHHFDWHNAALDAFDVPNSDTQSVAWQINWWERVWEEDAHEDVPLLRLAAAWLRQNMPPVDHLSVVHGDLRTGNFLYDEATNHITALLDWETVHIGDRHEDIVYMTNAPYRQQAADGTGLLGGLLPEEAFYELYEKLSGLSVMPARVKFYKVLNSLKVVAVVLGAGYRVAHCGKSHQDIVAAWVMGLAAVIMEDLRRTLEDVL